MKKIVIAILLMLAIQSQAQERLLCRNASVKFFSKMPLENIEAVNNQGLSVIHLHSMALTALYKKNILMKIM